MTFILCMSSIFLCEKYLNTFFLYSYPPCAAVLSRLGEWRRDLQVSSSFVCYYVHVQSFLLLHTLLFIPIRSLIFSQHFHFFHPTNTQHSLSIGTTEPILTTWRLIQQIGCRVRWMLAARSSSVASCTLNALGRTLQMLTIVP